MTESTTASNDSAHIEKKLMVKIRNTLNVAFETLLEMYTVQLAMYYTLGHIGDEVDSGLSERFADHKVVGERNINHADIVFGVRIALKRSADIANNCALNIDEFNTFLLDPKNRQLEQLTKPSVSRKAEQLILKTSNTKTMVRKK